MKLYHIIRSHFDYSLEIKTYLYIYYNIDLRQKSDDSKCKRSVGRQLFLILTIMRTAVDKLFNFIRDF